MGGCAVHVNACMHANTIAYSMEKPLSIRWQNRSVIHVKPFPLPCKTVLVYKSIYILKPFCSCIKPF